MRSRTEMVTTTFVDSEEDYSEEDDSEEDWRPSASNKNGKKHKYQKCAGSISAKRGRKRKSSSTVGNKNFKRKIFNEDSDDDELSEQSGDNYDNYGFEAVSGSSKIKATSLPEKNSSNSSNDVTEDTFNLLVYIKDITGLDLNKSNRLCLWRKDNNNLLQKYIRVKTSPEQFLFTSSSVYSSFDDKRISDFYEIKVVSTDSTDRRVKIINPSQLQKLCLKNVKINNNDNILIDKKFDLPKDRKIYEKSKGNLRKSVPNSNEDEDDEEKEEYDEEENDSDLEGDNEEHSGTDN